MLEARIEQEARRLGVSKYEFVKDALERVLGLAVDDNHHHHYDSLVTETSLVQRRLG